MVIFPMVVSDAELDLMDAIREVRYGEIYGVELKPGPYQHKVDVSQNLHDLLISIRDGFNDISVLTVHQGEPTIAESDFKHKTFCCRKKIKFPTS
jgi:hypothetical protein